MNGYATRERAVDCGALYESVRGDLIAMVRAADASELEAIVPATPKSHVRDVVAHVTGITEDLNAGNFGDGDADAFTRAQVERHRAAPLTDVVAIWDARKHPQFEAGLQTLGYQIGNHFVGDLFIHVVDVASTLGAVIERDSTAVWVSLDWYLDALEEALADLDLGSLEVISGPERRVIGTTPVTATVTASPFEMLRACRGPAFHRPDRRLRMDRRDGRLSTQPEPLLDADPERDRLNRTTRGRLRRNARGSRTPPDGPGRP